VRVFLAGATGAIGRPLVPKLVEAGHDVVGTTRSEERAAELRSRGADAAIVDALDTDALRRAVVEARPDVVVNQLTDLPREASVRYGYGHTAALRGKVTPALIEAGREAGARRIVAQSISFMFAPTGDWVKDETAPTMQPDQVDGAFAEALGGTLEMEHQVVEAEGLDGVVLRYGFFYGPGTWFARGTGMEKMFKRRMFPVIGDGRGVFSWIHIDDAAAATVAAVERGPTGIYNVVDDEPAPVTEWVPVFAEAVGAKPPRHVPLWLGRLVAKANAVQMTTMRGASNDKAKRELGWEPGYASWRQGFREGLD
jgi:nucleoside-diphosphate-sugar epimerase